MKTLERTNREELTWIQPAARRREFELRAGDDLVATLKWEKTRGSVARGESAAGAWTFKRAGFLRPLITVRTPGSETEIAVFQPNWNSQGTLDLGPGGRFRWTRTNFWRSHWAFTRESGNTLIHFRPQFGFLKQAAGISLQEEAISLPDLYLLLILGWYLMILTSDDAAAATVAAVSG
ncbi:MAG TPA: hypothetical protein VGK99_00600 [Acidobacteriota bacterium]